MNQKEKNSQFAMATSTTDKQSNLCVPSLAWHSQDWYDSAFALVICVVNIKDIAFKCKNTLQFHAF